MAEEDKTPFRDTLGRFCYPVIELEFPDLEETQALRERLSSMNVDVGELASPPEILKMQLQINRQAAQSAEEDTTKAEETLIEDDAKAIAEMLLDRDEMAEYDSDTPMGQY